MRCQIVKGRFVNNFPFWSMCVLQISTKFQRNENLIWLQWHHFWFSFSRTKIDVKNPETFFHKQRKIPSVINTNCFKLAACNVGSCFEPFFSKSQFVSMSVRIYLFHQYNVSNAFTLDEYSDVSTADYFRITLINFFLSEGILNMELAYTLQRFVDILNKKMV